VAVATHPLWGAGEEESLGAAEDSGFNSLPFFGNWAEWEEMQDSTAWARPGAPNIPSPVDGSPPVSRVNGVLLAHPVCQEVFAPQVIRAIAQR
jgi:hypothetical protein